MSRLKMRIFNATPKGVFSRYFSRSPVTSALSDLLGAVLKHPLSVSLYTVSKIQASTAILGLVASRKHSHY
jgi:hypothetical protein